MKTEYTRRQAKGWGNEEHIPGIIDASGSLSPDVHLICVHLIVCQGCQGHLICVR